MFNSVLIVCVGNICRSPTGERLLQKYCPQLEIDSAGLGALVGHEADESAKTVAGKRDVLLENHCAKQITAEMCRSRDLILVMEKKHINDITKLAPEVRGKTMLFGHWAGQREIPDPYRKSMEAFDSVYILLDEAAQKWANALNR